LSAVAPASRTTLNETFGSHLADSEVAGLRRTLRHLLEKTAPGRKRGATRPSPSRTRPLPLEPESLAAPKSLAPVLRLNLDLPDG
jgi:hypothetical protein